MNDAPLKPTPITNETGVLLPYQKRWIADTAKVKVVEKTRRCGLSFGEAADCALLASQENGMDTWYVGYNHDMAQEFIRDCAGWAAHYNYAATAIEAGEEKRTLRGGKEIVISKWTIQFPSGKKITALSSEPANLRAKKGRIVIDEAAFHHDLKGLIKAAMAVLMWGGEVHFISTHNGTDNPFNQLVQEIRAGKKRKMSLHRITLDDAVADGLVERIFLTLGQPYTKAAEAEWLAQLRSDYGDDAVEELDCIPSAGGGKYLSIALINECMNPATPIVRIKRDGDFVLLSDEEMAREIRDFCEAELLPLLDALPRNVSSYFGQDFARYLDLSVLIPLLKHENLVCRVPFILEMSNLPFAAQRQIIWYVIDRLPNFIGGAMDAGGNGANLAEDTMRKYGQARIAQIQFSQSWYRDHMPKLKSAFEDKTLQDLPKHADVEGDLRTLEMVRGIPQVRARTKSEADKGQQRHGDTAIALALGVYARHELNCGPVRVRGSRRGKGGGRASRRRRASGRSDLTRGF